jgi:sterol desaturase/sphingolipid hydroxylase (fatty acid hydroxylase superfamily)
MLTRPESTVFKFLELLSILLLVVKVLELNLVQFPIFEEKFKSWWTTIWVTLGGEDDWFTFVFLMNLWGALVYWVVGFIFFTIDYFNLARRYKIQPGTNDPIDLRKFAWCVGYVTFNQLVTGPLLAMAIIPLLRWRGISYSPDEIPGANVFLRHLSAWIVAEEFGFYYSHRLFHEIPYLYQHIHKIHHEWPSSVAFAARYAHPIEDILANVSPLVLGPLITGSHMSLWFVWIAVALFSTELGHSGYHFPFVASAEFHDAHHHFTNCNFGMLGLLDAFHGTDKKFRESVESLRHYTLMSFRSAREEVPDSVVKKIQ